MLKAMVLGCGRIAGGGNQDLATHAGAYQSQKGVSIAACIDIDNEKSNYFAKTFQCEVEEELNSALEKHKPDIISVCTPDETHYQITVQILEADYLPKVIFLEKPACRTPFELEHLIGMASDANVSVVVNHSRRFNGHHQQLRARIGKREFGELRSIYATYYSGWQHNGIHIVDTLSFLFRDTIVVDVVSDAWESPYEGDRTMELQARFRKQKSKIHLSTFDENDYQLFEMDLRFSRARLRLEDFGERILLETMYINDINERVTSLVDNGLQDKKDTSMQYAINLICKSIYDNDSSLLDGYLLSDVADTLKTIWQGQEKYAQIRFN